MKRSQSAEVNGVGSALFTRIRFLASCYVDAGTRKLESGCIDASFVLIWVRPQRTQIGYSGQGAVCLVLDHVVNTDLIRNYLI